MDLDGRGGVTERSRRVVYSGNQDILQKKKTFSIKEKIRCLQSLEIMKENAVMILITGFMKLTGAPLRTRLGYVWGLDGHLLGFVKALTGSRVDSL